MASFTVSLDKPRLIAQMEKLAAGQLKKRAERLGVQGVKQVQEWIDQELGPSTGSSAKRGMVSMRDLDWQYRVINPGTLPVTVEIFCDDIVPGTATSVKFWSLNSGHRQFKQEGKFKFTGEKAAAEGDVVVTETDEPKTEGHEWVDRLQAVLTAASPGASDLISSPPMSDPGTDLAIPDEEQGIETTELEVFGEKFHILQAMNSFSLMRVFDPDEPAELSKYLIKAIASRDRRRFITLMAQQVNMSMEDLMAIFGDVIEAQSDGRPTEPSPESSTGSRKKAASTRSAGN